MEYLDKNEIVVEHEGVGYSIDYLERMYGTKYYFWLQSFTFYLFFFLVSLSVPLILSVFVLDSKIGLYAILPVLLGFLLIIAGFGYVVKHGVKYFIFKKNENYKGGKNHIKLYNKLISKVPEKIKIEVERSGKKRMLETHNHQKLHSIFNGYA